MSPDYTVQQVIHVHEGATAITRVFPKKWLSGMNYIRIMNDFLVNLAVNGNLASNDWKVLAICLGSMEFENRLDLSQTEMGNLLQVPSQTISRSMKKLIKAKCLRIETQRGKQNIYLINPHLAFKTMGRNLEALKEAWGEDGEPEGDD
jgi:hypothetical protein